VIETNLLQRVRSAWADVLEVDDADRIPLDTNFLEVGGNSLLLVMLWEQLQELTTRSVKLSDLFAHGTVRAQVALLSDEGPASGPELSADLVGAGGPDRRGLLGRSRRGDVAGE
jgi:hypothetical protein